MSSNRSDQTSSVEKRTNAQQGVYMSYGCFVAVVNASFLLGLLCVRFIKLFIQ